MMSVLLLSGGASRRMGQNKAHLRMSDGRDLLSWQECRLRDAGFEVVSRLPDQIPGYQGPLAGIQAALTAQPQVSDWLVLPVDMPLISAAAIRHLVDAGRVQNQACCFASSPLPVYLPVTPLLRSTVNEWLMDAQCRRSVFALMECLGGRAVPSSGFESELININTPAEWQSFMTGAELA